MDDKLFSVRIYHPTITADTTEDAAIISSPMSAIKPHAIYFYALYPYTIEYTLIMHIFVIDSARFGPNNDWPVYPYTHVFYLLTGKQKFNYKN